MSLFITMGSFAQTHSGTCGANLTWTLNASVLTISGTGAMTNYTYMELGNDTYITSAPWGTHASSLKSLVINEGVTHIGDNAFSYCIGFTGNLTIPNSVKTIGMSAFRNCTGFKGSLTPNSALF